MMDKRLLIKQLLYRKEKRFSILDWILFVILGGGLILMAWFFISLVLFTATNKSIVELLPAEKTTAYFELDNLTLPSSLDKDTILDFSGLKMILENSFGLELHELEKHLTQGIIGMAWIKNNSALSDPVLFARIKNRKNTLDFLKSLALDNEELNKNENNGFIFYSFPQSRPFIFSFAGPYLFIAKNPESLESINSVLNGSINTLANDTSHLRTFTNLPQDSWARGYIDLQNLSFSGDNRLNQIIAPLKQITDKFGLTIRKKGNGLMFNTLMTAKQDFLKGESFGITGSSSDLFTYSLTDHVGSDNTALYIGGSDMTEEWQNTLETISKLNPAYGIILEGIVRAKVQNIFGEDVSLRNDIYPLFQDEYAIVIEDTDAGITGFKIILKHSDKDLAEAKLEKLLKGFRLLASEFAPKLEIYTLPDGTESKELAADPSRLQEDEEVYNGYSVNCLDVTDSIYGFCFAVADELIIMGNDTDSIKESLDLLSSPRNSLSQSQSFRQAVSNLSPISDEITFIKMDNAENLLKESNLSIIFKPLFDSFESIVWVKRYFNDGAASEGFLLLKD